MKMIRFESDAGAPVTMSDEFALAFIRMMGHSPSVPGAILAADIADALEGLRSGVQAEQQRADEAAPPEEADAGGDDEPPPVRLSTRAFPLVRLLEAAARERKDLMWQRFDGVYI